MVFRLYMTPFTMSRKIETQYAISRFYSLRCQNLNALIFFMGKIAMYGKDELTACPITPVNAGMPCTWLRVFNIGLRLLQPLTSSESNRAHSRKF